MISSEPWSGVGRHPTPLRLVEEMAKRAVAHLANPSSRGKDLRLLDLFAGDGRLGFAAAAALKGLGHATEAVFVEAAEAGNTSKIGSSARWEKANAFEWKSDEPFDLVVCNPPYEKLGTARARSLCLPWDVVKAAGCNLYCLGIIRALEACKPGGVTVAIAPFGWLSGVMAGSFRESVSALCHEVHVYPESSRSLFPGVHQDIAIQIFVRRGYNVPDRTKLFFSGSDVSGCVLGTQVAPAQQEYVRVRVGPLVWNRNRDALTDSFEGTLPVVYGGCITPEGRLDLSNPRFQGRRRVSVSSVPQHFVTRAPAILLRRVMRGGPGTWRVDASAVNTADYVVENHVIAVEFFKQGVSISHFKSLLVDHISAYSGILGSPTISVSAVKEAVTCVLDAMSWANGEDLEVEAKAI